MKHRLLFRPYHQSPGQGHHQCLHHTSVPPRSVSVLLYRDPVHKIPHDCRKASICQERAPARQDPTDANVVCVQDVRHLNPVEADRRGDPLRREYTVPDALGQRRCRVERVHIERNGETTETPVELAQLPREEEIQATVNVLRLCALCLARFHHLIQAEIKVTAKSEALSCVCQIGKGEIDSLPSFEWICMVRLEPLPLWREKREVRRVEMRVDRAEGKDDPEIIVLLERDAVRRPQTGVHPLPIIAARWRLPHRVVLALHVPEREV